MRSVQPPLWGSGGHEDRQVSLAAAQAFDGGRLAGLAPWIGEEAT